MYACCLRPDGPARCEALWDVVLMPVPEGISVEVAQQRPVLKISPQDTVAQAARRMRDHEVGSLLVVDQADAVVGIVTERDIIASSTASSAHPDQMRVADVMTTDLVSVKPDATVSAASQLMAERGIRHLPIVEDGRVVGIISTRDIMTRQLRLTEGMKAAAEQVALLSRGLRKLDLEEVIEILSAEVPQLFEARRWVLYFVDGEGCSGRDPLVRGKGCPCCDDGLVGCEEAAEWAGVSEPVSGQVPEACQRLGCGGSRVLLPLGNGGRGQASPVLAPARRSYLCMCGLPPATGDDAEVLQYKLALIRDILTINLMNAKLHRVAYHDSLTGLRTRRLMEEVVAQELSRGARNGHPFCVVMVDVDHFKAVNDEHGHPAGDKILLKLAETLRDGARRHDVISRHGGDEFVLLMPETELADAAAAVERIRRRVQQEVSAPNGQPITVSCGIAEWSGKAEDTAGTILRRADVALYEAKRAGRNRVVTAAPAGAE